MSMMRRDSFRDLIAIHDRMNRLFETALSGSDFPEGSSGIGTWTPASDIVETETAIVVSCELPGLEQDRIDIKLEDNLLTVSGDRRLDRDSESDQYHRIERAYGPFSRTFTVPVSVDPERISATYRDGVLAVTLRKRPGAMARTIAVRVS